MWQTLRFCTGPALHFARLAALDSVLRRFLCCRALTSAEMRVRGGLGVYRVHVQNIVKELPA